MSPSSSRLLPEQCGMSLPKAFDELKAQTAHDKGSHPQLDESPVGCEFLQDVASALSNHDQFVTHRRSRCVANRTIQLPTCAADLMVAAYDLDEA